MTNAELESKIYDTYYDNGGDDARMGLWGDVVKCKGDIEKLQEILKDVENGLY